MASKTIAIINAKGGVGKTTLALNLAQYFTLHGKRVLVADCDPQGSCLAWASLAGQTPFTVGRGLSPGFDITIMDMPPRLPDKLPVADKYVVPTTLDGVSFVVFLRMLDRLRQDGKDFIPVVNRFNISRAEHRAHLKDHELAKAVVISERAGFGSSYAKGVTVFELATPYISHSQGDITRLAMEIMREREQ